MFTRLAPFLDDLFALAGFALLVAGIYLWLGLPFALIALGIVLIVAGWRIEFEQPAEGSDQP